MRTIQSSCGGAKERGAVPAGFPGSSSSPVNDMLLSLIFRTFFFFFLVLNHNSPSQIQLRVIFITIPHHRLVDGSLPGERYYLFFLTRRFPK